MAITPEQIRNAEQRQHLAAHDPCPQVRLIAGPGTGKSFTIQEKVCWLLEQGVAPENIYVVSFTRASSRELKTRIDKYCENKQVHNSGLVSVSTLHSLALRALRQANQLSFYPASPSILDEWELKQVIDSEFSVASQNGRQGYSTSRCEEIRLNFEAYWCTGNWNPPNYVPPSTPISDNERQIVQPFFCRMGQVTLRSCQRT